VPEPRIFLNYRREDTRGYAGRLYDRLSDRFGEDQILRDVDAIPPGIDYIDQIDRLVRQCDLMLVLIGETWLSMKGPGGRRRLDEPGDLVSLEIAAGLERNIPVIPVLFQGARMPTEDDLPDRVQALARRNALEMTDTHWNHDWDRLRWAIEELTKQPSPRDHSEQPASHSREGAADSTERRVVTRDEKPPAESSRTRRPMGRFSTMALAVIPLVALLTAAYLTMRSTGNRSDGKGSRHPSASLATTTTADHKQSSSAAAKAGYPNSTERELLKRIPSAMRHDCDRAARPMTGAVVAIRCTENNGPSVQYNLFHTNNAMYRVFNSRARVVGAQPGPCNTTATVRHLDKAIHDEKPVGRLLCYTYRGEARLEWTNELLKVYTYAFSNLLSTHELFHTVYQHAGPHSHEMAGSHNG